MATQGGPVTPVTATATPQAYIGANDVPPIVVNYDILFVQAEGFYRQRYDVQSSTPTSTLAMTSLALSSHLFYNHQILEWTYAEEPFKTIWTVREKMELFTSDLWSKNKICTVGQDMMTQGNFESVAVSYRRSIMMQFTFAVERPNPRGGGL